MSLNICALEAHCGGKRYRNAISKAVASILENDQWIWHGGGVVPGKYPCIEKAIRQAIMHFARLFGALTGPQELANFTRAKVLLSAIMHALTSRPSREPKPCLSKSMACYMRRDVQHTEHDAEMNGLTVKLASSFHALCVTPLSPTCQNIFLRRHIMLTLALIRRGLAPSALASGWAATLRSQSTTMHPNLPSSAGACGGSVFGGANGSSAPPVISRFTAASAVLLALDIYKAMEGSIESF